jgi:cellulose synthase/poly-beta-1,6-N-acetylglucosamine synthase-like glycosyltransferase
VLTLFVATHNGAETLPRLLTAYQQLHAPRGGWKVVIIDNGSDDGSGRITRAFADRLPLTVIDEPRRGKNRALNTGLQSLEGDLAVFSDDDAVPEPDWLMQLRTAADEQPDYAVFGGRILPLWEVEPEEWLLQWMRAAPAYGITDSALPEGHCKATKVWGANMAIRAEWFRRGYRFDERLGPNGSATYSMGSETELTLRLAIAEQLACWHCTEARVSHIIKARVMTRAWLLKRAFNLGRCVHRESRQNACAGRPYERRDASAICAGLARELANLVSAYLATEARRVFEARWQLNLWYGCLYEALSTSYRVQRPAPDVSPHA